MLILYTKPALDFSQEKCTGHKSSCLEKKLKVYGFVTQINKSKSPREIRVK